MEKILLDTDFVIDLLRGYTKRINNLITRIEKGQIKAFISLISVIELYAGEDSEEKETIITEFLSLLDIIPLDFILSKSAGNIKRKYNLSLADAIIAATSSYYKIKLFTFNLKHFQNIPEIDLYHPDKQF
ncbi:PIN domain-containing protein [Candidatus Gottesmanbacteria bacterium]|nr:PIN domain-containing protein [Candidatus Gottesmanbacteria bacterium]